jgi:hypothetical protein
MGRSAQDPDRRYRGGRLVRDPRRRRSAHRIAEHHPASAAQTSPRATSSASAPVKTISAKTKQLARAEAACYRRPSGGQIYVRMLVPGLATTAQELGGEWVWDHTYNKCLSSVPRIITTAPMTAGNCTQVGYVSENPGYDPNITPALPIKNVVAQAGPACD